MHVLPSLGAPPHATFPPPPLPRPAAAGRRSSKHVSRLTSFTGNYVRLWPDFLPDTPLTATPLFDGRAVLYPTDQALRDYLSWRQADTHINNQYNTCFWALVKDGKSPTGAQAILKVGSGLCFG